MEKLIDAEQLKQQKTVLWDPALGFCDCVLVEDIDKAPAVDAVEVVHGRWKFLDIDGWWFDECSICGNTTPNRDGSPPDWNYCPNCGAKMDLEASPHGDAK